MNRYLSRSRSSNRSSGSKKSSKRSSIDSSSMNISEKYKDLSDEELAELIGISKLQFKKLDRLVQGKYMSRPDINKFTDLMKEYTEKHRNDSDESGSIIVMDYGRLKKRSKRSKKRSKSRKGKSKFSKTRVFRSKKRSIKRRS